MSNPDGTIEGLITRYTPVDRVAFCLADVARARIHVDAAMSELERAVEKLIAATQTRRP